MTSTQKTRPVNWLGVLRRTWNKAGTDDILGRSAQLAYYFFLAIFPMLIFLISTLGILPGAAAHVRDGLFQFLSQALPPSASQLMEKTMDEIATSSSVGKLSFGLILSLWSASAGMLAIMSTLNAEHGVTEGRSFFKQRWVAVWLTLGVATLLVVAVSIILIGESPILALLADWLAFVWKLAQWPAAFVCILLGLALIYYHAPNLRDPKWHWISPGAVVGCGLWLLASVALRLYLHFFNSYSATYGSLGAVIILLFSFYLTAVAILIGAEVNVVIEEALGENKRTDYPGNSIMGGSEPTHAAPLPNGTN